MEKQLKELLNYHEKIIIPQKRTTREELNPKYFDIEWRFINT